MGKAFKFAILGGLAGAGYAGYQALQQDETIEDVARRAATVGGEFAAAGLVVGFVLDRRSRRKAKRKAALALAKKGKLGAAAMAAKPAMEKAIEYAAHAAEVAKPKVEHAAEVTFERAQTAAAIATPIVVQAAKSAAKQTKEAASHAADAAKPKVIDLRDKVAAMAADANIEGPKKVVLSLA